VISIENVEVSNSLRNIVFSRETGTEVVGGLESAGEAVTGDNATGEGDVVDKSVGFDDGKRLCDGAGLMGVATAGLK
jgi:hypothetical protein